MIYITSYNRPEFLLRLLKELEGEQVTVVDDGSEYNPIEHMKYCDYYRLEHRGKEGFWITWDFMLSLAKETKDNEFIFIPDDVYDVNLTALRRDYKEGCLNVLNVGKDRGWSKVGYVDCGFICNRSVLEKLEFRMFPIRFGRFKIEGVSSGVGQQLSHRLAVMKVPMYTTKNYASHGDHESVMHKEERLKNPLICKTDAL